MAFGTNTRLAIRQAFAKEVGPFYAGTAPASGSTTAYLLDTAWPIKSDLAQNDTYDGHFLYIPAMAAAGNRLRLVKSYEALTGKITPDLAWTVEPHNEPYELHGVFQPDVVNDMINNATKHMFLVDEVAVTVSTMTSDTSDRRYLLSASNGSGAIPWISDPRWVRRVGVLTPNSGGDQRDHQVPRKLYGRVYQDNGATLLGVTRSEIWLECGPRAAAEVLYITVVRPYYDAVIDSQLAGIGYTAGGFVVDADKIAADIDWIVSAVLMEAWRKYANVLEPLAAQKLARSREEAAAWYTDESRKNFILPPAELTQLKHWGPM